MSAALPPVAEVVPHRGRALLLGRIAAHDAEGTTCEVAIGPGSWLRRGDGSVPAWLGIEYMAQCIAAHEGCRARAEGRTLGAGFLVRARGVKLHRTRFAPGERLRVRVRRSRGRPGLRALTYACEIQVVGGAATETAAEAELTIALQPAGADVSSGHSQHRQEGR